MDRDELIRAIAVLQAHVDGAAKPSPTVAELHAKYEPWYKANHPRSWKSAFVPRWIHLNKFFGEMRSAEVTLAHADEYRAERAAAAPESRNCELQGLHALFVWAVKRKLLALNPIAGLDREHAANARTAFLDEAGFARLAAAAPNPMARTLFLAAFDTGMRRGELIGLKRANVDLDALLIRLGDADCKNGSGRVVPLIERTATALRELPAWSPYVFSLDGGPLARSTVHVWFATARAKSGTVKGMTFHGLRHSCATLMRRRGVPWPLIKTALGWKTDVAARRYQQYSADDWAALRERMNVGIATEGRKPPLRSMPEIPLSSSDVGSGVKALAQK